MEMPDVLNMDVWKFNIAHQLMLNNYSKCLMRSSTALHTSLKHIFFKEMHKYVTLQCVNFNRLYDYSSSYWQFLESFWKLFENIVAIKAILPISPFCKPCSVDLGAAATTSESK